MIPRLNRQLFEATVFDSGALGLTTSVIHQFTEPGIYRASVRRDGRHVGETMFEVHGDAARMQLDIDLAAAHPGRERKDDCCCGESDDEPPTVSPKGYVLFHAKSGSGWSVRIGEDEPAAFDSMRLTKGDMFALMLLEPTRYRIENAISQVRASAEVGFSDADARRLSGLLPVTVDAGAAFNPEALKLVSTQGLVFRIESDARIVITREEKRDPEPRRGARRVQRPRPRAAGPARPRPRRRKSA